MLTTKSMYRWFLHRGVVNKRLQGVWKSKLPMKLKVFLWQIFHNKLQTGVKLKKKRKWRGSEKCNLCEKAETVDHIFFSCVLAKFVWVCFKEALGWDRELTSWQDFLDNWIPLGCRDYSSKLFLSTIVFWALWIIRNKRVIEGKFPRYPTELLIKSNMFLQKWKVLLRGEDQVKIEGWVAQVKGWLESFMEKLRRRPPEDTFL